jgi:hypothetical protein
MIQIDAYLQKRGWPWRQSASFVRLLTSVHPEGCLWSPAVSLAGHDSAFCGDIYCISTYSATAQRRWLRHYLQCYALMRARPLTFLTNVVILNKTDTIQIKGNTEAHTNLPRRSYEIHKLTNNYFGQTKFVFAEQTVTCFGLSTKPSSGNTKLCKGTALSSVTKIIQERGL